MTERVDDPRWQANGRRLIEIAAGEPYPAKDAACETLLTASISNSGNSL
ncbi:MAG TPA: hypothetical protein VFG04_25235 [Planctomycetaceae bacterium]|jgi:hypothetical protein|nr:hypothetical protein [Planctomycetaceae bacterium]